MRFSLQINGIFMLRENPARDTMHSYRKKSFSYSHKSLVAYELKCTYALHIHSAQCLCALRFSLGSVLLLLNPRFKNFHFQINSLYSSNRSALLAYVEYLVALDHKKRMRPFPDTLK